VGQTEIISERHTWYHSPRRWRRDPTQDWYTKRIKKIYGLIKRKNDFGCSYAIWAVCQDLEEMLISRREPVIDQGMNDHTEHDITILNWKKNKFWLSPIFGSGNIYPIQTQPLTLESIFPQTRLSVFPLKNGKLNFWNAKIHFSQPKKNSLQPRSQQENERKRIFQRRELFLKPQHGSIHQALLEQPPTKNHSQRPRSVHDRRRQKIRCHLEHRFYPFFMIQFHPEKNTWEHRSAGLKNLNRDEKTLQIVNGFMDNFIRYIRFLIDSKLSNCGWKDKIGMLSSQFLSWKYPVYPFLGMTYESLYLFKRLRHRELAIPDYVSRAGFQDGIYHTYAMLRYFFIFFLSD
jgi:hypothetical protein